MLNVCSNVYTSIAQNGNEKKHLVSTMIGKTINTTLTQLSMTMETPNKKNARNMYTTLRECLENQDWLKGYEKIKRDTSNRLKNHLYDD